MEEGARRQRLAEARNHLSRIPKDLFFELPGRPTVVFQVKDYTDDKALGRASARADVPFLFRAFESGQAPPPRPGTKKAELPRASTIHEYLDWTVTSAVGEEVDELDFGGFRVVALLPRFRPGWPPPGTYEKPVPRKWTALGAPLDPLPQLLTAGKPICAATIRVGLGYLEVPFFATADGKRNRGYGRALLEAIEDIARCLGLPMLLLCSTDDPVTKATWRRLGFGFSTEEDLTAMGVGHRDLLHMDNTVQMHKAVPPPRPWKSVILRHQWWRQRVYYLDPADMATPPPSSASGLPLPSNLPPLQPPAAGTAAAAAVDTAAVPLSSAILPAAAPAPAAVAAAAQPNGVFGGGGAVLQGGRAGSLQGGVAESLPPTLLGFGEAASDLAAQKQNGSSAAAQQQDGNLAVADGGANVMADGSRGGSRSDDGRATGGGQAVAGAANGALVGGQQPEVEPDMGGVVGKAGHILQHGAAAVTGNGPVPMEH